MSNESAEYSRWTKTRDDRHDERARRGFEISAAVCAKLMNNVLSPLLRMRRMNLRSIRAGRRYGGDRPVECALWRGFESSAAGCAKLMNNVLNPLLRMRRMNPRSIRAG